MADDAEAQIAERLQEAEDRMERSLESLHKELGAVRTGRATPALVERVQVEYYGTMTPLQQLASISAPEARLLVIQPYDRSAIVAIEKAIQKGEMGLNPSNDGQLIRIQIPQLTEDRRRDFVKLCKAKAEDARVAIRNIRRDEVDHLRRLEKDGVSRDQVETSLSQVQRVTDRFVAQVDAIAHKKEAEILEV
ncbi:MAG: ribosome recycling factor [Candidatus Dormibacteria bacterium]